MPKYWITYSRDLKERVSRRLWMGSIQKFQNLSIHEFNTSNWYDPASTNTEKICVESLCCGVRDARWWCYLQYTWKKFGNTINCNIHNEQNVTLCLQWCTAIAAWHFVVVVLTQITNKGLKYVNAPLALWTVACCNKLKSTWEYNCWCSYIHFTTVTCCRCLRVCMTWNCYYHFYVVAENFCLKT
jgi:hypothetical protein